MNARPCCDCGKNNALSDRRRCGSCEYTRRFRPQDGASRASAPAEREREVRPPTVEESLQIRQLRQSNASLREQLEAAMKELTNLSARTAFIEEVQSRFAPMTIKARSRDRNQREAAHVLCCSDWHVEETVDHAKVNGLNEFNLDIADKRIDRLLSGFLWTHELHKQRFHIRDIILWLGGDLISGHIHPELMSTTELHPSEAILWLMERIVAMVDELLASTDVEKVRIPCTPGNHGRTTEKMRVATSAENSFEWMLYQFLAMHYRGESRVEVYAPKASIIYVDVYNTTIRFMHGHEVQYNSGVGGITIPLNKFISRANVGREADMTCIGHWHSYTPGRRSTVNGSLIGYNEYAASRGFEFEPPQQASFLVDSQYGVCMQTPIWVE